MNLITFSHQDSLLKKKDEKLLRKKNNFYVGDWCLKQDNIFLREKKKYKAPKDYHWDVSRKLDKDCIYIKKVHSEILNN